MKTKNKSLKMVILFSVFVIALLLFVPAAAFAEGETGDDSEVGTSSATSDDGGDASSGTDEPTINDSSTDTDTSTSGDDSTSSETDGSDTGVSDNSSADEGDEQNADTYSDSDSGDAPDPDSTSTAGSEPEEPQTGDDEGSPDSETNSDDPADDQLASDGETDDLGSGDSEPDSTLSASAQEPEDDDSTIGNSYAVELDPTVVLDGDEVESIDFEVTFTELNTSGMTLGSAQMEISDGFDSVTFDENTISATNGEEWYGSLEGDATDGWVLKLWATSADGYLTEGESVSAVFSAQNDDPLMSGTFDFETKAWTASDFNDVKDDDDYINNMAEGYSDPKVAINLAWDMPSGGSPAECGQAGCDADYSLKVDKGSNGTYDEDDDQDSASHDNEITISNSDGFTFDWESEWPVSCVIVKSGTYANIFYYPDGALSGTDLFSPTRPSTDKLIEISHVTFCFNDPGNGNGGNGDDDDDDDDNGDNGDNGDDDDDDDDNGDNGDNGSNGDNGDNGGGGTITIPPGTPGTSPEVQTLELAPEEPGTQPEEQVLLLDPEAPGTTPDSGGTILPMLALSLMLIGSGAAIKKFKVK